MSKVIFSLVFLSTLSGVFSRSTLLNDVYDDQFVVEAELSFEDDMDMDDMDEDLDFLTDDEFLAAELMSDEEVRGPEGYSFFSVNQRFQHDLREGDILDLPTKEASITRQENFWPNGQIRYVIESGYSQEERNMIARAMNEYHQKTCIKFIPKESNWKGQFIRIRKGNGCFSMIGMVPTNQMSNGQEVTLGIGCLYNVGTPIHELMHAIGFEHEQSRLDRDNHVQILWNNIEKQWQYAYDKADTRFGRKDLMSYDFGSVMHYHQGDFGVKDSNGRPKQTMKPINAPANVQMGRNDGFSPMDIQKINQLYKCKSG